jgi:hypothetical protein
VLHEQLADDHGRIASGAEWPFRLVNFREHGQRLERTNVPIGRSQRIFAGAERGRSGLGFFFAGGTKLVHDGSTPRSDPVVTETRVHLLGSEHMRFVDDQYHAASLFVLFGAARR